MPRRAKELGPLEVSRLKEPGFHSVGGVAGLALQVSPTGARSWILRARVGNKRRDIGLGGYPGVTLAGAREKAREKRDQIDRGVDPIEDRRAVRSKLIAEAEAGISFSEAAAKYIAAHELGWKNGKHAQQWRNTLSTYAEPVIGRLRVSDIETSHVVKILEAIWSEKAETASRLRSRIELVLDWAAVRGYRKNRDNPARWRGHLDKILPARGKVAKVAHFTALPFVEVAAFLTDLRKQEGMGARGLEFAILTAARSGEVRGATWNEIDLDAAVWTIPAGRMKAGKEHRIPLNDAAVKLLAALPRMADSNLIFPNTKGESLSDMTLTAVIRRMDADNIKAGGSGWRDTAGQIVTAHGFRSAFRDWAGETGNFPREVIEHALAHQLADKAEAAYARGTLFEKRRRLMKAWATHCERVTRPVAGNVTPISKGRAA